MASTARITACVLVALSYSPLAARADDPPQKAEAKPSKARVEFRWIHSQPVPGVTEEKGIHISETEDLSYLQLKPVLTNDDVAHVRLQTTEFGPRGFGTMHYTIHFQLTKDALRKLEADCDKEGLLGAVVDGRYYGTVYYLKSRDKDSFVPFAGFIAAKAEAERIVGSFK